MFQLQSGLKSRLPVPLRLRGETSNSRQIMSSDHPKNDAPSNPLFDDTSGQQLSTDTDGAVSSQYSSSPSCTLGYPHRSCSPVGSDKGSDARLTPDHTYPVTELELLHQECQEKEVLINKLNEQLADWEELQTQLQEKDRVNRQYMEALQAAESTIAYLTACSLDSQGQHPSHHNSGPDPVASDANLYRRCTYLQNVLQEKERLNNILSELLNTSEKFITSSVCHEKNPEISDLCSRIDMALQQVKASSDAQNLNGDFGTTGNSTMDIKHHTDCQQNALWERCRPCTGLHDDDGGEDAVAQHCHYNAGDHNIKHLRQLAAESLQENEAKKNLLDLEDSDVINLNPKTTEAVVKCLSATESAVASLVEHCTDISASGKSTQPSSDLQMNLDNLQRALQESSGLRETNQFLGPCETKGRDDLHSNLCRLYKVFADKCQRILELQASLQEEKSRREDHLEHKSVPEAKGLPPSVKVELETLHKALREKKKACKSLEERLATALTNTPIPENAQKGIKTFLVT